MRNVKILRVSYKHIPLYKDGKFTHTFLATDRVSQKDQVYHLKSNLATQKISTVIGINAAGKTSTLKLLCFAMSIVLNNDTPNGQMGNEFVQEDTEMQVVFVYEGKCYKLTSVFGKKFSNRTGLERIYFKEETIHSISMAKVTSKAKALFYDNQDAEELLRRTTMPSDVLAMMQEDYSIVRSVTRDNDTALFQLISMTNVNLIATHGKVPVEVLHAFDPILDELAIAYKEGEGFTYTIKFGNQDKTLQLHAPLEVEQVLSSGTIKGQNMIPFIRDVLLSGGYLLVDELENHMNKELLRMITKIFKSEKTNPNGACLVFSTHYVEVLDFIDRKDNIYVVRRAKDEKHEIELINYADVVKRSDIKKSEVILSNYIGGTAPQYENIKALEDYLCQIHA